MPPPLQTDLICGILSLGTGRRPVAALGLRMAAAFRMFLTDLQKNDIPFALPFIQGKHIRWRNNMDDFLSESKLNKAYRETGLSNRQIQAVENVLDACAHFYAVLELREVWRIAGSKMPVTKAEYEKLLPVFEKDPYTLFSIMNEKDFYGDGEDVPLLVDSAYFVVIDESYKPKRGADVNISDFFCLDDDRFDDFYRQRAGKRLSVPPDLMEYADPDYYTETKYTAALLKFLEKNLGNDIDPEDALLEAIRRIREGLSFSADMTHFLWNLIAPKNQTEKNLEEYLNLYMELQNHTPLPHNRGAAPTDVRFLNEPASYRPVSSGVSRFANGFEAEGQGTLPDFSRLADLARRNSGPQPGFGNGGGGTVRAGKKIGPNDPCPCGSGKKYKKCCGSK